MKEENRLLRDGNEYEHRSKAQELTHGITNP
jgi:hypothetical protein